MKKALVFLIISTIISCGSDPNQGNYVYDLLQSESGVVQKVISDPAKYKLQILYTQIDRDSTNRPTFTTYPFNVDDQYFYPASTVKMPTAFLALEKLNELNIEGLDRRSIMITDSAFSGQSSVEWDSTSANLKPSVEHYIKQIFLVSSNDAYNRLYEFLGQEELNDKLRDKGFTKTRLTHRLSIFLTQDENRHVNPVRFYSGDTLVYAEEMKYSETDYTSDTSIMLGVGHFRGEEMIYEPMDFKEKNYMSLVDMQNMLIRVLFPEEFSQDQRFGLTEDDYQFVYQYMSELPGESSFPKYDYGPEAYYDSYVKFFMFGDNREPMPDNIRIFNKVGDAYGFLIDNAYVVDFENNIEFLLSAVIQVNENQIYNDGNYEYDAIGFPFLARLGQVIYQHELERDRDYSPDLSRFRFIQYD